jgi:hypothetical protein
MRNIPASRWTWLPKGAQTTVEGNPCTTIEQHLWNTLQTPTSRASSPGIHRILHHLLPIPLELGRIWTKRLIILTLDFLEDHFLASERVLMCWYFWVSRVSELLHNCNEMRHFNTTSSKILKKCESFAMRYFMWPRCEKKFKKLQYGSYSEKNHEMSYCLRCSMAFRLNGLGYGPRMDIVCWNEVIWCTCMRSDTRINVVCMVLPSWLRKTLPQQVSKQFFCVKPVQGAQTMFEGNPSTTNRRTPTQCVPLTNFACSLSGNP